MPPKQLDSQKELTILLQRARRNSCNPLLVKVVDWTGNLSSPSCCATAMHGCGIVYVI